MDAARAFCGCLRELLKKSINVLIFVDFLSKFVHAIAEFSPFGKIKCHNGSNEKLTGILQGNIWGKFNHFLYNIEAWLNLYFFKVIFNTESKENWNKCLMSMVLKILRLRIKTGTKFVLVLQVPNHLTIWTLNGFLVGCFRMSLRNSIDFLFISFKILLFADEKQNEIKFSYFAWHFLL